jgi:hypothetical protein
MQDRWPFGIDCSNSECVAEGQKQTGRITDTQVIVIIRIDLTVLLYIYIFVFLPFYDGVRIQNIKDAL